MDKYTPCGFFDGAFEGNMGKCGVGGVLFLSEHHPLSFSYGLGLISNNIIEVKAVLLLVEIQYVDVKKPFISLYSQNFLFINYGKLFQLHCLLAITVGK